MVVRAWPHSVVLFQHPQNGKEQVENVEVKGDRRPDVLVVCEALDQVLSVVNDVTREDYGTDCAVDSDRGGSQWVYHLHLPIYIV